MELGAALFSVSARLAVLQSMRLAPPRQPPQTQVNRSLQKCHGARPEFRSVEPVAATTAA